MATFHAANTAELRRILDLGWRAVPMDGAAAPALAPERLPRGLGDLPIPLKKRAFLRAVLPLVVDVNDDVARERERLAALRARWGGAGHRLPVDDLALVAGLARKYRVPQAAELLAEGGTREVLEELLLRIDQVPVSLALAQAALESGWGTSRFAVEGNSLFGQWVFSGRGMAPVDRPAGARYSVARYPDLRASVAAYVRNLNTSWAYQDYRALRAGMRATEVGGLDPLELAGGLLNYSSRREAYVQEVRAVIRGNRLARFDSAILSPAAEEALVAASADPGELAMDGRATTLPPDA